MKKPIKMLLIIMGGLFLLGACMSVMGDNQSPEEATKSAATVTSTLMKSPTETTEMATEIPATKETSQTSPEQDVPREYKNALKAAKRYLDYSGFSYQGLYDQLTSEYGDNYPAEAAQYAVDNVDADWVAEARESAEHYLEFSPFSREELINQLSSEYGDKYTLEQAQAAVDAVY